MDEKETNLNEAIFAAICAMNTLIQNDVISKSTKDLLKINKFKQYLLKLQK